MATIADLRKDGTPVAQMKPKDQIAHLLEVRKAEIAKMLPRHLTAERLLKVAQIAATTTPALLQCDIPSLIGAIGQCALLGLEPNTPLGHAYLLPFNTRRKDAQGRERWVKSVQVIVGYKGMIDLARRSGQIVSIAAHEVCEHDTFDFSYGLVERLEHKPNMTADRGRVVAFYAVAHLKDGGHAFEVMSSAQVDAIRKASEVKNKRESAVWAEHYVEMGRKTAIRRLSKYLPLSIEMQTAVALDEIAARGKDQHIDDGATIDGLITPIADDDQNGITGMDDAPDDAAPTRAALENDPSKIAQFATANVTDEAMAAFDAEYAGESAPESDPAPRRARRTME